jgi:hypothetical protein
MASRVMPLIVVVVVLFSAAKFLHQHNVIREIIRELRDAVTLKITYRSIDFFGFVAIFALIVLCYIIHELREILKMALAGARMKRRHYSTHVAMHSQLSRWDWSFYSQ